MSQPIVLSKTFEETLRSFETFYTIVKAAISEVKEHHAAEPFSNAVLENVILFLTMRITVFWTRGDAIQNRDMNIRSLVRQVIADPVASTQDVAAAASR